MIKMDQEIQRRLDEQSAKIDAVFKSVEKIRRHMLITAWVTIIVIVLPLIGLIFAIPAFLKSYMGALNGLGL